jgi:phenylalanine-4-hydroxylase
LAEAVPAAASALVSEIRDPAERVRTLTSILRAMARFFWFTIEFGLMRSRNRLRAYGSGLLSSFGEIERAIHETFEIDHYQPLLFIVATWLRASPRLTRSTCKAFSRLSGVSLSSLTPRWT